MCRLRQSDPGIKVVARAATQPGKHGAMRRGVECNLWGEGCEDVVAVSPRGASAEALPSAPAGIHYLVRGLSTFNAAHNQTAGAPKDCVLVYKSAFTSATVLKEKGG